MIPGSIKKLVILALVPGHFANKGLFNRLQGQIKFKFGLNYVCYFSSVLYSSFKISGKKVVSNTNFKIRSRFAEC